MSIQETELQYTERLLREMIAEASAAEEARAEQTRAARAKADRDKAAKTQAILARAAKPFLPRASSPALQKPVEPVPPSAPEPLAAEPILPKMAKRSLLRPVGLVFLGAPRSALRGMARLAAGGTARIAARRAAKLSARKAATPVRLDIEDPATSPAPAKLAARAVAESALTGVAKPSREAARPVPPAFAKPRPQSTPHTVLNEAITASRDSLLDGLFPETDWPQPPKAQYPRLKKKDDRRSDLVFAALGITLGLICALFPWYIFFNQDQFGVQAIKFGGSGTNAGRVSGGSHVENSGQPLTANDVPDVDLFATGTLQDPNDPSQTAGAEEQPFPGDPKFRMVHVANGRAMIEDDAGLWIVQRGSKLPDSSIVSSIEQRGGKWVMVTSSDQVIELSK